MPTKKPNLIRTTTELDLPPFQPGQFLKPIYYMCREFIACSFGFTGERLDYIDYQAGNGTIMRVENR